MSGFASFFLLNIIIAIAVCSPEDDTTLELVHLLFRHGERTTDSTTLYPKDPHINETYYPYGLGQLTNKGKQTEYKLGQALRERYGEFLGKIYTPDMLEAWSSDFHRTKMSMQLVLAGLFPPIKEQIWEIGLNWQPIPYNVLPRKLDKLFYGIYCPNFRKLYLELINSPRMLKEFDKYNETFRYLSENTGLDVKTFWDVFFIHASLLTEDEFSLKLPEWTKKVYPNQTADLAIKSYGLLTATTELKRLTSGYLLKKIIDESMAKTNEEMEARNRKLFLYSAHELNIAYLMQTLDIFMPQIPPYGSYVALELHKINNTHGFKIYYQNYSSTDPWLMKLPACDEFCPLDQFVSLVDEYLPNEDSCGVGLNLNVIVRLFP